MGRARNDSGARPPLSDNALPTRARALLFGACLGLFGTGAAAASPLQIGYRDLPCPNGSQIAAEIERELLARPMERPILALLLRSSEPGQLEIWLIEQSATMQRTVPFTPADCPELSTTVTYLVRGWLSRDWDELSKQGDQAQRTVVTTGTPVEEQSSDEHARLAPSPLRLFLLGGAGTGSAQTGAAALTGGLESDLSRELGASLFGRFDGTFAARLRTGSLSAHLVTLGLELRAGLLGGDDWQLELLTGPAWTILHSSSEGFDIDGTKTLHRPAWLASIRLRAAIWRGLDALLSVDGAFRESAIYFRAAELGQGLTIPALRFGVQAGFSWAFGKDSLGTGSAEPLL